MALVHPPDQLPIERLPKRRRTSNTADDLATPPSDLSPLPPPGTSAHAQETSTLSLLKRATYILSTEAAALANISSLYETSDKVRQSFADAVAAIVDSYNAGGKLITCGVGKSAYICMKFTATCKSLGVPASFMHACEAAHGDLGDVRKNDVVLFISYSGRTPELLNILPSLPTSVRILAMTSHLDVNDCALTRDRSNGILVPTPIPEKEEMALGVSAPTISTTVALAVSDMLAMSVAEQINTENVRDVFKRNHPGGTIGMNHREAEMLEKDGIEFTVLELPSPSISGSDTG